jgi:thiol-disulfide isomerase/thioredoxin
MSSLNRNDTVESLTLMGNKSRAVIGVGSPLAGAFQSASKLAGPHSTECFRLKQLHPFLLAGLVLAGCACLLPAQPGVGDPLPDWAGAGLEGSLPDTGGRVLLVDFWASWCAPCKESFPDLAGIHRDFTGRGVTLVAISVDKNPRDYAAFLKKYAPPFATVRDTRQEYVAAVGVPAMPTTVVVGRDRKIRAIFPGYHGEKTGTALRAALEAALAEKS